MIKDKMSANEFRDKFKLGMITQDKKGNLETNKDNAPGIEKLLSVKKKKVKPTCPVTGIEYDSNGEVYLSWWLNELQDNGYIKKWTAQPESFILSPEISKEVIIEKQLKTKVKIIKKKEIILRGHKYTADFRIEWTDKAFTDNFVKEFDLFDTRPKLKSNLYAFGGITYLEAKPDGLDLKKTPDPKNMVRLFANKQKEVYNEYNILVELVYHNNLFCNTFVPFRYVRQDKANGNRAIKYNVNLINQFLN